VVNVEEIYSNFTLWLPNRRNVNPLDCKIRSWRHEKVYKRHVTDILEPRGYIVIHSSHARNQLDQRIIDTTAETVVYEHFKHWQWLLCWIKHTHLLVKFQDTASIIYMSRQRVLSSARASEIRHSTARRMYGYTVGQQNKTVYCLSVSHSHATPASAARIPDFWRAWRRDVSGNMRDSAV